jgi:hypothetical protein
MSSDDAFQLTAQIIRALPFGDAAEAVLRVISYWYHANKDVKALLGELPERVDHFGKKIAGVRSSTTEDCSWLSDILRAFEAELQVLPGRLLLRCGLVILLLGWRGVAGPIAMNRTHATRPHTIGRVHPTDSSTMPTISAHMQCCRAG